jgi:hypothetical protein
LTQLEENLPLGLSPIIELEVLERLSSFWSSDGLKSLSIFESTLALKSQRDVTECKPFLDRSTSIYWADGRFKMEAKLMRVVDSERSDFRFSPLEFISISCINFSNISPRHT